ncbi:hypothetical protein O9K51_04611 [Purpureocillium lavendulum]|uniref:Uncharacterized protein n=1 Tax=Purpureocillium lavendulum TaxID=1247861 RepID=A0AB34FYE9_9HYPO|nr:hypothetical protein O9K51_04611 [Purpureocillium lavendulum]
MGSVTTLQLDAVITGAAGATGSAAAPSVVVVEAVLVAGLSPQVVEARKGGRRAAVCVHERVQHRPEGKVGERRGGRLASAAAPQSATVSSRGRVPCRGQLVPDGPGQRRRRVGGGGGGGGGGGANVVAGDAVPTDCVEELQGALEERHDGHVALHDRLGGVVVYKLDRHGHRGRFFAPVGTTGTASTASAETRRHAALGVADAVLGQHERDAHVDDAVGRAGEEARRARDVQDVEAGAVVGVPVEARGVVLGAKRAQHGDGLGALAVDDGARRGARLARRTLAPDERLVAAQERADAAERQGDARARAGQLGGRLVARRAPVLADGVEPLLVGGEAHAAEGVVVKTQALGLALRRRCRLRRGLCGLRCAAAVGRGSGRLAGRVLVRPLGAQDHGSLRAEAHVGNVRAAHNVQRLVAVLGDVVVAVAVVLDEDVVERVAEMLLRLGLDGQHGRRERQQRRGLVGRVAVDGHGAPVVVRDLALHGDEARDLAALMRHALPLHLIAQPLEHGGLQLRGQEVIDDVGVACAEALLRLSGGRSISWLRRAGRWVGQLQARNPSHKVCLRRRGPAWTSTLGLGGRHDGLLLCLGRGTRRRRPRGEGAGGGGPQRLDDVGALGDVAARQLLEVAQGLALARGDAEAAAVVDDGDGHAVAGRIEGGGVDADVGERAADEHLHDHLGAQQAQQRRAVEGRVAALPQRRVRGVLLLDGGADLRGQLDALGRGPHAPGRGMAQEGLLVGLSLVVVDVVLVVPLGGGGRPHSRVVRVARARGERCVRGHERLGVVVAALLEARADPDDVSVGGAHRPGELEGARDEALGFAHGQGAVVGGEKVMLEVDHEQRLARRQPRQGGGVEGKHGDDAGWPEGSGCQWLGWKPLEGEGEEEGGGEDDDDDESRLLLGGFSNYLIAQF